VSENDAQENEYALSQDLRILSAYTLKDGTRLWIVTEGDRSATTILLPANTNGDATGAKLCNGSFSQLDCGLDGSSCSTGKVSAPDRTSNHCRGAGFDPSSRATFYHDDPDAGTSKFGCRWRSDSLPRGALA